MDLNRIEKLAGAVRRVKEAKFTSTTDSVEFSPIKYLNEDVAREIRNKLNDAVKRILSELETDLRKELSRCGKD